MEIERKFIVNNIPFYLESYEKKNIEQGYLLGRPTVRIRKSNEDYYLTYKSRNGIEDDTKRKAKVLNEYEFYLDKKGYEHLKQKIDHFLIQKTRYIIPLDCGFTAELDIFEGKLNGLCIVEVEFPDEDSANQFEPPEWFGQDVSLDNRYTNARLSMLEHFTNENEKDV